MSKTAKTAKIPIPEILKKIPAGDFNLILRLSGKKKQEFVRFIGRSPAFVTNHLATKNYTPVWLMREFIEFVGQDIEVIAELYEQELEIRAKQRANRKRAENI